MIREGRKYSGSHICIHIWWAEMLDRNIMQALGAYTILNFSKSHNEKVKQRWYKI